MGGALRITRRSLLSSGAAAWAGARLTNCASADAIGTGAAVGGGGPSLRPGSGQRTKSIAGSWISIQHPNPREAALWDPACAAFTEADWRRMVQDMAGLEFKYLVLLSVAYDGKAFYDSQVLPRREFGCDDPIGALLSAADECGLRFFVGCGWFGNWADGASRTDPLVTRRRLQAMGELAERYGGHKSFYGWYAPSEAAIRERFSDESLTYINTFSAEARRLTPGKKTLIAPYGTRLVVPDDRYVRQLEKLDVDFIAYQDEVGVRKTQPDELPRIYGGLRKAHDRVPQRGLWADVEIFTFAGEVYQSALIPAPFERVRRQLAGVSPYVDTVLVYQYQGLMNPPASPVSVGHADSVRLYVDYMDWLKGRR